jgi:hypothetical protein
MIDIDRFRATPLVREPFGHLVVPRFIHSDAIAELDRDFPSVPKAGSFPLSELSSGPAFDKLVDELHGDALRKAVESKLEIDLTGSPTMLTVRGHARAKDGRIHTDSTWKLVTLLIYVNGSWSHAGGHLRLLRSPKNLDDYFADIRPEHATAVLFRSAPKAWHGHTPYVGERRAIQLNWVEDASWVRREQGRHRWSSKVKRIFSGAPTT